MGEIDRATNYQCKVHMFLKLDGAQITNGEIFPKEEEVLIILEEIMLDRAIMDKISDKTLVTGSLT